MSLGGGRLNKIRYQIGNLSMELWLSTVEELFLDAKPSVWIFPGRWESQLIRRWKGFVIGGQGVNFEKPDGQNSNRDDKRGTFCRGIVKWWNGSGRKTMRRRRRKIRTIKTS